MLVFSQEPSFFESVEINNKKEPSSLWLKFGKQADKFYSLAHVSLHHQTGLLWERKDEKDLTVFKIAILCAKLFFFTLSCCFFSVIAWKGKKSLFKVSFCTDSNRKKNKIAAFLELFISILSGFVLPVTAWKAKKAYRKYVFAQTSIDINNSKKSTHDSTLNIELSGNLVKNKESVDISSLGKEKSLSKLQIPRVFVDASTSSSFICKTEPTKPSSISSLILDVSDVVLPQIGLQQTSARIQVVEVNIGLNGLIQWNGVQLFHNLFKTIGQIKMKSSNHCMLDTPIDHLNLQEPKLSFDSAQILGRSYYLSEKQLTLKKQKPHEANSAMANEAKLQLFLNQKKNEWGLRSEFPQPEYCNNDKLYYTTPEGYHDYLTDIKNDDEFYNSLEICAHDFGRILREGIVFPEPISVFHGERSEGFDNSTIARFYTALPSFLGHHALMKKNDGQTKVCNQSVTDFGGFPGKIDHICKSDHHLYPDLGKSGLRDVGDCTTIEQFVKHMNEINQSATPGCSFNGKPVFLFQNIRATEAVAVAHFLSMYQMTFMLIIAKREQQLGSWIGRKDIIKDSFCNACHSLIVAFLDLDQEKADALKLSIKNEIDTDKFFNQMRFSFTNEDRLTICAHEETTRGGYKKHEGQKGEFLPTEEAISQIWRSNVKWTLHSLRGSLLTNRYNPKTGFNKGHLGNNSAPNPLIEGMLAILNFSYQATKDYFLTTGSTLELDDQNN